MLAVFSKIIRHYRRLLILKLLFTSLLLEEIKCLTLALFVPKSAILQFS